MPLTYQRNLGVTAQNAAAGSALINVAGASALAKASNMVVVGYRSVGSANGNFTVTDTQGNTYTKDLVFEESLILNGLPWFVGQVEFSTHQATPLGAGDRITINFGANLLAVVAVIADEFGGPQTSPIDVTSSAGSVPGSALASSGAVTTTKPKDLLYVPILTASVNPAAAVGGSGFQQIATISTSNLDGLDISLSNQFQILSAVGMFTGTGTVVPSNPWIAMILAFQEQPALKGSAVGVGLATGAIRRLVGNAFGVGLATGAIQFLRGAGIGVGLATGKLTPAYINFTQLFTFLGLIEGIVNAINTSRGTTIPAKTVTLNNTYAGTPFDVLDDAIFSQLNSYENGASGYLKYLKKLATNTVITVVNANANLPKQDIASALAELIRQMKVKAQSVKAMGVTAVVAANAANTGNAVVLTALIDGFCKTVEYALREQIQLTCTVDAQSGGATAGQETIAVASQGEEADSLWFAWPQGSNISNTLTNSDEGGSTSLLTDGGFESWAGSAPSLVSWTALAGAFGSTIKRSATAYKGTYSVQFACDGATAPELYEPIAVGVLKPNTVYAMNCWVQRTGAGIGPGPFNLEFGLYSALPSTVIDDDLGNHNRVRVSLASTPLGSWQNVNGVFRTPRVFPAENTAAFFAFFPTTPPPNGVNIFVDSLVFMPMDQLYQGGPFADVFAGNTPLILGDSWNLAIGNTYGGDLWGKTWQGVFQRFFDMRSLGLILPSATGGAETLPDSLIT